MRAYKNSDLHLFDINYKYIIPLEAINSTWLTAVRAMQNLLLGPLHIFTHILFVKSKLFKIYYCSFYGAPLWFLYGSAVNDLCVASHKALRKLWNVPPQTHNKSTFVRFNAFRHQS